MARRSRKQENAEPQESSAPKHLSKYAAKKIAQAAAEARGEVYVSPKQAELTSNTVAALYGDGDELSDLHSGRVGRAASEAGAGVERGSDFDESTGERKRLKLKKGPTMVTMPGTNVKVPASRLNEDGTLKKRKTYIKVKRKDGSKIRIARRKPTYEKELFIAPEELAKLPERVAQKRLKRVEHENQIKEARKAALAKLRAEGKRYDPSPDAVAQNRFEPVTVVTLGIKTQDRVPDYDDPLEVESAKQPHNMRSSLLFAPIKRVNKPIVGTDFLAKWLEGWEKRNDAAGIFHDLFAEVKRVRAEENGIAYIGLPAFLLFIEGVSKRDIIDSYALEFKRFIKRREVTDFIAAMKGPALSWFAARHNFDSAYALVYFDTYPVHFKLGRKRVYVEHELFMIGVTLDGRKDLLGVIPDFSSKRTSLVFWDTILGNLKNLGCQHICFALAAFKCRFLDKALRKHYPEATLQYNLLEVMQFDSYQLPSTLRKEFMADSAQLCEAADYSAALTELNELRASLAQDVSPQLTGALDALASSGGRLAGGADALVPMISQAQGTLLQLDAVLAQASTVLAQGSSSLREAASGARGLADDLAAVQGASQTGVLPELLAIDPAEMGGALAAPVEMVDEAVFPVATYGSGVAPFYTNLALWVGGFVLVAVYKLEVDREGLALEASPAQAFWGRWMLLALLGQIQALVCCAGDLALGVQCVSSAAFVLAGMVASLVYVLVVYVLAATFKHVGKALAVLMVVLQIPGASGLYPIQMQPAFFQALGPWLPFTYGINAMREAVAGFYGANYAHDLLALLAFAAPAIAVAVALRPRLLGPDAFFDRQLGASGLLISERTGERAPRRLGALLDVLATTPEGRSALAARAERFERSYPARVRRALVSLVVVPLCALALSLALPAAKLALLALWVASLALTCLYLVGLAYARDRLEGRKSLSDLGKDELVRLALGEKDGDDR